MTLQKITKDNSAKFFPQSEQTQEKKIKPKTMKKSSVPRKQIKNNSQIIKKFIKDYITVEGFKIIIGILICYF